MTMKTLLPFLFAIVGCNISPSIAPTISTQPIKSIPIIIASGTNGAIDWRCGITEFTTKTLQVECAFRNTVHFSVDEVCASVNFYDESTIPKLTVEGDTVCSGRLDAYGTITHTMVFNSVKVLDLYNRCGKELQNCIMLASRVYRF